MKCIRTALEADVVKYEVGKGIEDGFEEWVKIVTQGWVVTDMLIKTTKPDGTIVCPYIRTRRGCTFIAEGDYVVIDSDGTKHVCGEDKVWNRYQKKAD